MIDQIRTQLGNYIVSNVIAIFLVVAAIRWPRIARLILSVTFIGAFVWNFTRVLSVPAWYVSLYGPLATPPYKAFIEGPFAANPALFVVPIAFGELALGVLSAGRGSWFRLGMVGVMVFLVAIAPMGLGSAFPFSIVGIVAAYLLFRRPLTTTLFEDIAARFRDIGRRPQSRVHHAHS